MDKLPKDFTSTKYTYYAALKWSMGHFLIITFNTITWVIFEVNGTMAPCLPEVQSLSEYVSESLVLKVARKKSFLYGKALSVQVAVTFGMR